jgi:hypothetical protein
MKLLHLNGSIVEDSHCCVPCPDLLCSDRSIRRVGHYTYPRKLIREIALMLKDRLSWKITGPRNLSSKNVIPCEQHDRINHYRTHVQSLKTLYQLTNTRTRSLACSQIASSAMHYSILLLSLLAPTHSLPLSASPDLAPQLHQHLTTFNTAVTDLTTVVTNFDGALLSLIPQGLGVISASTKVDATVLSATVTTRASANFTAAESTDIVQTLATQITPIQTCLNALKNKVCLICGRGRCWTGS